MGRKIRSKAIEYGRNRDLQKDNYVHCGRCGFICNLDRDRRANENSREINGIRHTIAGYDLYDDGLRYDLVDELYESGTVYEDAVVAGCPFCGTLLYHK